MLKQEPKTYVISDKTVNSYTIAVFDGEHFYEIKTTEEIYNSVVNGTVYVFGLKVHTVTDSKGSSLKIDSFKSADTFKDLKDVFIGSYKEKAK